MKSWSILYRGSLSSCNYTCDYCPFGKTKNTRTELKQDEKELKQFMAWVSQRPESIGVLFTPWGEGLIRKYYQDAMTELSYFPNIHKVAIQTNISCKTDWMNDVNKETFALWTTYHPTQITRKKFVQKCKELDALGIRYSVGVVGFKDQIEEIQILRDEINPNVYLWINAYKREKGYYSEQNIIQLKQIDPLFGYNAHYHESLGKSCEAGESAFTVNGNGDAFRCHFIKQRIGNIYEPDFEQKLIRKPCTISHCGCHIGYVHINELNLYEVFGKGLLERIPKQPIWQKDYAFQQDTAILF